MDELAKENNKLNRMTDAERRKYFHDKAHKEEAERLKKKEKEDHHHAKKPQAITSAQSFQKHKIELKKEIDRQNIIEMELMGRIQDSLHFHKPSLNGIKHSARITVGQQITTMGGTSMHGANASLYESTVLNPKSARPIYSARVSNGGVLDS